MLHKIYKTLILVPLMIPIISFAEQLGQTKTLFQSAKDIITTTLIPLVFTLALLLFFWGIVKYIWGEGQGKEDGRKIMIWGIVALFVMASVWGIVTFIQTELLGGPGPNTVPIPTIGGSSGSGGGTNYGTDPILIF